MGIGIAFATGALKGWTSTKRAMLETEKAKKATEAENQKFYQEQFFELAGKKDANPQALSQAAKLGGLDFDIETANIINNVDTSYQYGSLRIPTAAGQSIKIGKAESAPLWANSHNSYFNQSPENINNFVTLAQSDENVFRAFADQLRNTERLMYAAEKQKAQGSTEGSVKNFTPFNMEDTFSGIAEVANRLGITSSLIDAPPEADKDGMLSLDFTVRKAQKDARGFVTGYSPEALSRKFTMDDFQVINDMAVNMGYRGAQDFINGFQYKPMIAISKEEQAAASAKTTEQLINEQYNLLFKAKDMHAAGYHTFLRDPKSLSPENRATLLSTLTETFKKADGTLDEYALTQATSLLVSTPENMFNFPDRKYSYYRPKDATAKATVTKEELAKDILGVDYEEFLSAWNARTQSFLLLNDLVAIESSEDVSSSTGLVRSVKSTLSKLGVQIGQVTDGWGASIQEVFTDKNKDLNFNGEFSENLKKGTTTNSLIASVDKLNNSGIININLEKLSAADAIRLSLAAKMARAIDPSGRLSNQDFEIQLSRLGGDWLDTPATIQAKLNVVIEEFTREQKSQQTIYDILTDMDGFSPADARFLVAHKNIQRLKPAVPEPTVSQQTPPTTSAAPDAEAPQEGEPSVVTDQSGFKPSTKTHQGRPLKVGIVGGQVVYIEENGTIVPAGNLDD